MVVANNKIDCYFVYLVIFIDYVLGIVWVVGEKKFYYLGGFSLRI